MGGLDQHPTRNAMGAAAEGFVTGKPPVITPHTPRGGLGGERNGGKASGCIRFFHFQNPGLRAAGRGSWRWS